MEYLHKTKGGDSWFYNCKHNLRPLRSEHNILTEKGRAIFDSAQVLTLPKAESDLLCPCWKIDLYPETTLLS